MSLYRAAQTHHVFTILIYFYLQHFNGTEKINYSFYLSTHLLLNSSFVKQLNFHLNRYRIYRFKKLKARKLFPRRFLRFICDESDLTFALQNFYAPGTCHPLLRQYFTTEIHNYSLFSNLILGFFKPLAYLTILHLLMLGNRLA